MPAATSLLVPFNHRPRRIQAMLKSIAQVTALAAILSAAAVTGAWAASPAKTAETSLGKTLVNPEGMTLYTFGKDTAPGKSACNGPCAGNWPPLKAAAGTQSEHDYSVITRDDGSAQWAYKGKPLYTFIKDTKPGDVTGQGVANGAWQVAKP
jgi:predicted lipoprotein with Yx(FWY)xxD motif